MTNSTNIGSGWIEWRRRCARRSLRRIGAMLAILGTGGIGTAWAQPITGYGLRVYVQGAAAPISGPVTLTLACNQAPPTIPAGVVVNPTRALVDDPTNAGKVCLYVDPGTGPLFSLPFGTTVYESTVTAINSAGAGPESPRSNLFTHPGAPPAAPTGHKIVKLFTSGSVFGFRRGPVRGDWGRLVPARSRHLDPR